MKTQKTHRKHIHPNKGWTLVQWAKQCWSVAPAAERAGWEKQAYISAMLQHFRGGPLFPQVALAPAAP